MIMFPDASSRTGSSRTSPVVLFTSSVKVSAVAESSVSS